MPKYFFDVANQIIPKRNWNGERWYKIAETRVFFTKEIFWKVIERWTKEIHLIIPPIERVEIIDDKVVDGDEIIEYFYDNKLSAKLQTFVDLGCGNGLLTYILTSEGYDGIGIDLRKRKIWDLFISKGAKLHVQTLQPNIITFPNHDWIIGNHADELVPWIPIISAKSSKNSKFMVIPCCFYSLSGFKYTFNNKKITNGKYKAYQEYIKEIIEQCGFTLEYDWLRIPSTKNYAMVGRKRIIKIGGDKKINDDDGEDDIDKSIQNLINSVGYISIRKNE
nr:7498_t:CDS:2 [Entrophospora candida]